MPLQKLNTNSHPLLKSEYLANVIRFRSGKPFHTGAVIAKSTAVERPVTQLPYFELTRDEWGSKFVAKLSSNDRVFGLGEMLGNLDKRGKHYRLFAKDEASHSPEKHSLYGSHPFGIVVGDSTYGFFLDFPGEIHIDVACKERQLLELFIGKHDFDFYIINGNSIAEIIKSYLSLVGAPYVPPAWAFGFQQSRYSYPNRVSIEELASNFRRLEIPCDMIYFDIDYMQDYKCFTVDNTQFPQLPELLGNLKNKGFKAVPILDPGIKVEAHYEVYESGLEADIFCKTHSGIPFIGAVWPGLVCLPDFFKDSTIKWWGNYVKELMSLGFAGLWNDMNEPAIFYTEKGLQGLREKVLLETETGELGKEPVKFISTLGSFWHSEDYYKEFYHDTESHGPVQHLAIHNLYGTSMSNASSVALREQSPKERYFLLSRSSYPGAHRNAVIWTGDNSSWWEQLLPHIRMMLSLNMCGFFYTGADIGGFVHDSSAELVVRWMQLGVLTPLYRNHSTLGSRQQECWAFDDEVTNILRDVVQLRYALFPYIYSEFISAVEQSRPFVQPLFFNFYSPRTLEIEDQFMCGQALMAAPVVQANSTGRFVHLPSCKWLHWSASKTAKRTMQVYQPGDYYIAAKLNELPLFIRENSLLALTKPQQWIGQHPITELTIIGLVTDKASFTYREDDGGFLNDSTTAQGAVEIVVRRSASGLTFDLKKSMSSGYKMRTIKIRTEIYGQDGMLSLNEHEV